VWGWLVVALVARGWLFGVNNNTNQQLRGLGSRIEKERRERKCGFGFGLYFLATLHAWLIFYLQK